MRNTSKESNTNIDFFTSTKSELALTALSSTRNLILVKIIATIHNYVVVQVCASKFQLQQAITPEHQIIVYELSVIDC